MKRKKIRYAIHNCSYIKYGGGSSKRLPLFTSYKLSKLTQHFIGKTKQGMVVLSLNFILLSSVSTGHQFAPVSQTQIKLIDNPRKARMQTQRPYCALTNWLISRLRPRTCGQVIIDCLIPCDFELGASGFELSAHLEGDVIKLSAVAQGRSAGVNQSGGRSGCGSQTFPRPPAVSATARRRLGAPGAPFTFQCLLPGHRFDQPVAPSN